MTSEPDSSLDRAALRVSGRPVRMGRIDGAPRGFELLEHVPDFLAERDDVLFRRRVGIAGAGALEGLPDGGEPAAHDDRRDHGRERRGAEGDAGKGQEQIVPGLPAALVGIAQVVQDHEVPRPPSGIQGEGADQDVVILVADDGEALRVGPGRLRAGEGGRHVAGGEAQLLSRRNSRWRAPARRWRCARTGMPTCWASLRARRPLTWSRTELKTRRDRSSTSRRDHCSTKDVAKGSTARMTMAATSNAMPPKRKMILKTLSSSR